MQHQSAPIAMPTASSSRQPFAQSGVQYDDLQYDPLAPQSPSRQYRGQASSPPARHAAFGGNAQHEWRPEYDVRSLIYRVANT